MLNMRYAFFAMIKCKKEEKKNNTKIKNIEETVKWDHLSEEKDSNQNYYLKVLSGTHKRWTRTKQ